MRSIRLKVILLAASVCAATLFAGAGTAFASAGMTCTFGAASGNTQTCFTIIGHGLFVNDMIAAANPLHSGRTLQECIHGPDRALPQCTPFEFVAPGAGLGIIWSPNRNVRAGTYCARTWQLNRNGSHRLIGQQCFDVHR